MIIAGRGRKDAAGLPCTRRGVNQIRGQIDGARGLPCTRRGVRRGLGAATGEGSGGRQRGSRPSTGEGRWGGVPERGRENAGQKKRTPAIQESFCDILVGATGFEPATPWSQTRCATKLRHAPLRLTPPRKAA